MEKFWRKRKYGIERGRGEKTADAQKKCGCKRAARTRYTRTESDDCAANVLDGSGGGGGGGGGGGVVDGSQHTNGDG